MEENDDGNYYQTKYTVIVHTLCASSTKRWKFLAGGPFFSSSQPPPHPSSSLFIPIMCVVHNSLSSSSTHIFNNVEPSTVCSVARKRALSDKLSNDNGPKDEEDFYLDT